ncbi:hypothetical protein CAEBREN_11629 [Caenorhabditis brenneri]|uniref:Uncharacterized protein n=1 Tax=Caenorhabditis brenneri TaxID=135651 RepID=G0P107_CAEBE|nr:hypothetical protein CAEBREN_11629 [Caenorhabditis brenneri]
MKKSCFNVTSTHNCFKLLASSFLVLTLSDELFHEK